MSQNENGNAVLPLSSSAAAEAALQTHESAPEEALSPPIVSFLSLVLRKVAYFVCI